MDALIGYDKRIHFASVTDLSYTLHNSFYIYITLKPTDIHLGTF